MPKPKIINLFNCKQANFLVSLFDGNRQKMIAIFTRIPEPNNFIWRVTRHAQVYIMQCCYLPVPNFLCIVILSEIFFFIKTFEHIQEIIRLVFYSHRKCYIVSMNI